MIIARRFEAGMKPHRPPGHLLKGPISVSVQPATHCNGHRSACEQSRDQARVQAQPPHCCTHRSQRLVLRLWGASLSLLAFTTGANAAQFDIQPAQSSASAWVSLGPGTGNTTIGLSGSIVAVVDASSQTLRIDAVNLNLTSAIGTAFAVSVGIPPFGEVAMNFSAISFALHAPVPGNPVSLSSTGQWSLASCSMQTSGALTYAAEGLACDRLTGAAVPCNGVTSLALLAPSNASVTNGLLTQGGSMHELSGQLVLTHVVHPSIGVAGGTVTYLVTFVATSAACRVDFDESGSSDVVDLFAFLDSWFITQGQSGPGIATDFDDDQEVTVDDLFGFLDAWFMGC